MRIFTTLFIFTLFYIGNLSGPCAVLRQEMLLSVPSITTVTTTQRSVTTAQINPQNGHLSALLTPSFIVNSNNRSEEFTINAEAYSQNNVLTGALSNDGNYIILTNESNPPKVENITNAKMSSPNTKSNPNTIAYPISIDINPKEKNKKYEDNKFIIVSDKNPTVVQVNIFQQPKQNTYSYEDLAGDYTAFITLTIVDK